MRNVSQTTIGEQFNPKKREMAEHQLPTLVESLGRVASGTKNYDDNPNEGVLRLQKKVLATAAILGTAGALFNMLPHDAKADASSQDSHETLVIHSAITGAKITEWDTSDETGNVKRYTGTITIRVAAGTTLPDVAKEFYGKTSRAQADVVEQVIADANHLSVHEQLQEGSHLKVYLADPKVVTETAGKTMQDIADLTGFDAETLQTINASAELDESGRVTSGALVLPVEKPLKKGESLYVVRPGDTLYAIAKRADIPFNDLVDRNNSDTRKLRPGQLIIEPRKGGDDSTSPKTPEVTGKENNQAAHILTTYGGCAKTVEDTYRIPHELTLAQLTRETGWDGKSELSDKANNFFGIKADKSWTGEVYAKSTMEEMTREQRNKQFPDAPIINVKDNGNVVITVSQDFRKYPSVEAGFDDYGRKITGRPYADALTKSQDPEVIAREVAKHWATDSSYGDGLAKIIVTLKAYESAPKVPVTPETKTDLTDRVNSLEITWKGYEQFKATMIDTSMAKYATLPIMGNSFEGEGVTQGETTGFVMHRWGSIMSGTDFSTPAFMAGKELTDDQRVAAKAIDVLAGRGLAINYFMTRSGKVFSFTDKKVAHIAGRDIEGEFKGQSLNGHLLGVEAESHDEGDLTNEQLTSYVYLSYKFLEENGFLEKSSEPLNLDALVVGHGELSEYRLTPSKNPAGKIASSPRADITHTTAAAIRKQLASLLESRGYKIAD